MQKNDLISPKEAAEYLCTTVASLATWRCTRRHALPYVKLGRAVRYRRSDLEKFITDRVVDGR
ncbi:MAG: helix-turn-helix domain-containing protein [Desulfobulbaceae bacterium]|nr:helix-turn-helix domain-containing protein [Desulfobulbaceae bacterium]